MNSRLIGIILVLAAAAALPWAGFTGSGTPFTLLTMGDLLVVREAEELLERYGQSYPFLFLEKELKKYDIVYANLEMSITYRGSVHPTKPYTFRLHPDNAQFLKKLKFDVLTLSNNHILDFGREGLYDTIDFLENWGTAWTGAGKNLAAARRPAVLKRGDTEVVILSYCERPPADFFATDTTPGTAPLRMALVREDIAAHSGPGRVVLVSLHWGIEHNDYPDQYQVDLAHEIIDAGADGIIGHHPHVPQGIELYSGKPIIYSLGNAVSGFHNPNYTNNMMVVFHYSGTQLEKLTIVPISGRFEQIKSQPHVLNGSEADAILNHIRRISRPFKTIIGVQNGTGTITVYPVMETR